ncbi:alpha/beta hydrolase [Actinocrispum sp. NPDC049592]|uniref:alpha/beta fold hydrolase n=1 Tax=Actinocrispum sp. NPDC049592 TaxID=3154835 RepID=UPI00343FFD4C
MSKPFAYNGLPVRCVRRARTGESPRLLLMHGLGGRRGAWDRFVEEMTAPFDLWDVELPWHGMSTGEWGRGGDPVRVLADLLAGERFDVLVAHSYTANLLTEAYATGLVRPRPSVLIGPCYRPSADDFDWQTISYYLNDFHKTFVEALRVGQTNRYSEAHRDWMALRMRDQVGPYGWMRFFETYLRSPFLDLTGVAAPVLVLTGEADIAGRPADGQALAEALPDGRFTLLPGCGHFPMLEQPQRTARIIGEFLTRLCSPAEAAAVPTTH